MQFQLTETELYQKWISFTANRAVLECDFFTMKADLVAELLGEFSKERLAAIGEHASGSLICFYSVNSKSTDDTHISWVDSEGSPCIVISKNLREFLSLLPYGPGFLYSIASSIENNYGSENLFEIVSGQLNKPPDQLLEEAKVRFIETDSFLEWLSLEGIEVNKNPVQTIVDAHLSQPDLTTWIVSKIS